MIKWKEQKFSDLNTKELYEIFKLRCEVFVVEQEILYNDFVEGVAFLSLLFWTHLLSKNLVQCLTEIKCVRFLTVIE